MATGFTVLAYLKQLLALEEEQATQALPLCQTALTQLRARLRANADENDVRFLQAAAAMAFYKHQLRESASGDFVSSFQAGDVRVKNENNGLQHAAAIREEALRDAAPLLRDEAFVFQKMPAQCAQED